MNKENWDKFLSEIIKSSINNFDMIGDNLRVQCVKYFEQLETNINNAIKIIDNYNCRKGWYENDIDKVIDNIKNTLLERGK